MHCQGRPVPKNDFPLKIPNTLSHSVSTNGLWKPEHWYLKGNKIKSHLVKKETNEINRPPQVYPTKLEVSSSIGSGVCCVAHSSAFIFDFPSPG